MSADSNRGYREKLETVKKILCGKEVCIRTERKPP